MRQVYGWTAGSHSAGLGCHHRPRHKKESRMMTSDRFMVLIFITYYKHYASQEATTQEGRTESLIEKR